MASARSVSRPCRRMVCPDLSRALFSINICFRFVSKRRHRVNQESYFLQAQEWSLEQRHLIQHARGNVKCGKRSTPVTDQSNSRYRSQAQLPTITRQAPGPPVARSSCVSSPSAISGLAFWVKSSECPHISQQSIEIDRQIWGEHTPSVSPEASGRVYSRG